MIHVNLHAQHRLPRSILALAHVLKLLQRLLDGSVSLILCPSNTTFLPCKSLDMDAKINISLQPGLLISDIPLPLLSLFGNQ